MIKQLPSGKLWLHMIDENGEKIRMTFDKKADAVAKEAMINSRKYEKKLIKRKLRRERYLFVKALEDFERTKSGLRKGTVKRYKSIIEQLRQFAESAGIQYVDEFTPDHGTLLLNLINSKRKDPKNNKDKAYQPKPKTVNMYLQVIKAFFKEEVLKEHIARSPVLHLSNLRVEGKEPDYYTEDELKDFFDQKMHLAYRNAFLGLLLTGMRFAEFANLKWQHIDFKHKLVIVKSTGEFRTKTKKSERRIPMSNSLFEMLNQMKSQSESEFVFPAPGGGILKERKLLDVCKKIAKNAGIKSNAFLHKFRHTYATILIQRGVRIEDIKELLGHSSIKETEMYAHHRPDFLHDKVSHLDKLLE